MENKEYKYEAFISYRHCELDKFVAEHLHKTLETYELPKSVKEKLNIKGKTFRRIFRDQEELPLTSNLEDPIIEALKDSKYLIVICSPRLKDSLWCKKEIETFKKLRGRRNIFCVLIEGEPSDSFPEEVLYDDDEKCVVEPLAADVRGKNKKEVLNKIKSEKLRLLAPMYGLDFDDLRQRHKLRRQKKILHTAIIVAIASILFAIYSIAMFIKIELQQNVLAEHHALSLVRQSEDYLNNDSKYKAIKSSYQALTNFEEIKMPYTPEAEYQLSESLGAYDVGYSYKSVLELKTEGIIDYIKISTDGKYAAVHDGSEKITLFNTKTFEVIKELNVSGVSTDKNTFSFIGNDIFSYINEKNNISLISTKDGKLIKEIEKNENNIKGIQGEKSGTYLAYVDNKNFYIYNAKEDKISRSIKLDEKEKCDGEIYFSDDSNYIFFTTIEDTFEVMKDDYTTYYVIDTKDGKEINKLTLDVGYTSGIITKGNNAYLLLNKMVGMDYQMLVVSYDFINGKINYTKIFEKDWGRFIIKSYPENTNNIAVANHDTIRVLNAKDGSVISTFSASDEIINVYSALNKEIYLLFLSNGSVNYINMEYKSNNEYGDKYKFNVQEYTSVVQSENGFILIPRNDNRVISYEKTANKNMKKEDIKIDYPKDDSIKSSDYDKIKEEYKLKNKSLVDKIFYDDKKELLFVNYKNNDIAIYNVKDKKLLKLLENVGKVNHYFGKDKYNRIYIGDISDSYIINENYDKVGHISNLSKLEKDKVIISDNNNSYYSIKIYNLDDLKNEAKEYLKENKKFDEKNDN